MVAQLLDHGVLLGTGPGAVVGRGKAGRTSRIINLVVILQIFTILASRGDVYVLGEAYAFGVIWSFTFNSLSMLVLRFKYKGVRGWKVPPNVTIAGTESPSVFFQCFSFCWRPRSSTSPRSPLPPSQVFPSRLSFL